MRLGNINAGRSSVTSTDSLTLSQLESHLWKAAWILKGPVDAADFKTYVFPLLFFKRISDVHDEESAAALAKQTAPLQPPAR
jgi:type I restriction enzyme M protein